MQEVEGINLLKSCASKGIFKPVELLSTGSDVDSFTGKVSGKSSREQLGPLALIQRRFFVCIQILMDSAV